MFKDVVDFIKEQFPGRDFIPLHEPIFIGNERNYINDAIDSTFVSSVGKYVDQLEVQMAEQAQTKFAVAMVNGTSALHIALLLAGVTRDDEVLSQALTFIATANAINYIGASPVFLDVDQDTLGLSPDAIRNFLELNCEKKGDQTFNKATNKRIAACIPMHTFGFPCRIDEIAQVCQEWNIPLIEDSAESIGSYYKEKHTGSFGQIGVFSFNGNKTITCGGGGMIVTNDESLAKRAKHITTQAKVPHRWEYVHDEIGYNYRMPNLNAALACAQLERLNDLINSKRELANSYASFFNQHKIHLFLEPKSSFSNYWLNTVLLEDKLAQQEFLKYTNENGVMTRPIWNLMNTLSMFRHCQHGGLENSLYLADRLVNIPSSARV